MKIILAILLLSLTSCYQKETYPKVGECYERFQENRSERLYEIVKVIAVNPNRKYNEISYVYNFPNSENTKPGQWYVLEPLTSESPYFFYQNENTKLVKCPW